MSDSEVVHEDYGREVVHGEVSATRNDADPHPLRGARRSCRQLAFLLSREGPDPQAEQKAIALVVLASRVALPEDPVSREQAELRQVALDFNPPFFVEAVDNTAVCPFRSRRLHQARDRIDELCFALLQHSRELSHEHCDLLVSVQQGILQFCSIVVSTTRVKFSSLSEPPYLFCNVCTRTVAAEVLAFCDAVPTGRLHRVTRYMMENYGEDIKRVADGGDATGALKAEESIFRHTPLTEAPIEGYHAQVARTCARAHGVRAPFVFSDIRLRRNLIRLQRWCRAPAGMDIVAYEWTRFKRVVKTGTQHGRANFHTSSSSPCSTDCETKLWGLFTS